MRTWFRVLVVSSVGLLAALSLAPQRSRAAIAAEAGCRVPSEAVGEFVGAWLGSFMTNGIGGFPKLCEKVCKVGAKGCDRTLRGALSCNLDSLDSLSSVDAILCRELPEPDRTACLEEVASNLAARRSVLTSNADGAELDCEDAVAQCIAFCSGAPI
jgi:hypothetical protein